MYQLSGEREVSFHQTTVSGRVVLPSLVKEATNSHRFPSAEPDEIIPV